MKKGFTLIELLVVVLIIGILAAVALPKYEQAVLKSRLGAVMPNVKTLASALEQYYMANGEYPNDDVTNLDISISGCFVGGGSNQCEGAVYDYMNGSAFQPIGGFLTKQQGLAYLQFLSRGEPADKRGTRECWADSSNTAANRVCLSLGGVKNGTSAWRAPDTKSGVWNTYAIN